MTKKDYEMVASGIAHLQQAHGHMTEREKSLVCRICIGLSNRFKANPSFDSHRFLAACKLPKVEGFNGT